MNSLKHREDADNCLPNFGNNMDYQQELEAILRKKGIGPEGSKSLGTNDISRLPALLLDTSVSLTTQATLLTALLTLDPNKEEREFINLLKADSAKVIRKELHDFITLKGDRFQELINKTIIKEDLSKEECDEAINTFLDTKTPEFQKGAFLEAQRLKRESELENERFFLGLKNAFEPAKIDLPELIDICDSYDGCKRNAPFSIFTSVVLGSLGYPTITHGAKKIAPKEGLTIHQILAAAGKNPLKTKNEVCDQLHDHHHRWAFIDQSVFHPLLTSMVEMRKEMVKRPFLATFEKLLQPIRAKKNHIVTSYTHTHYKNEVMRLLKSIETIDGVLHIKGVEGTTMPSLSRSSTMLVKHASGVSEKETHPSDFAIEEHSTTTNEFSASEVVKMGEDALKGNSGFALDQIVYQSCTILHHICNLTVKDAKEKVVAIIESGQAWKSWKTAS